MNRKLGGEEARSKYNPLSHTYIIITDDNGQLEATLSWGNTYTNEKYAVWHVNTDNDVKAAKEALRNGDAKLIGGNELDEFVIQACVERGRNPMHKSRRHKWRLWNNCKHEAKRLIQDAKAALEKEKCKK